LQVAKNKVPNKHEKPPDKIITKGKSKIHPDTDDSEVEVVFVSDKNHNSRKVDANIVREAKAEPSMNSQKKNDDERSQPKEVADFSTVKEVRINKKRAYNCDDDKNLEADLKKRKVIQKDSCHKSKVDEPILNIVSDFDEDCSQDIPKNLQHVKCDNNNIDRCGCATPSLMDLSNDKEQEQQSIIHNFHGELRLENELRKR
jgi:hypothetical protein